MKDYEIVQKFIDELNNHLGSSDCYICYMDDERLGKLLEQAEELVYRMTTHCSDPQNKGEVE